MDEVVKLIADNSRRRSQYVPTNVYPSLSATSAAGTTAKIQTGGATIFVLNVESFMQV